MNLRITDCYQLSAYALRYTTPHLIDKPHTIFTIKVSSPSHGEILIGIPLDRDAAAILADFRDDVQTALSETDEAETDEADAAIAAGVVPDPEGA